MGTPKKRNLEIWEVRCNNNRQGTFRIASGGHRREAELLAKRTVGFVGNGQQAVTVNWLGDDRFEISRSYDELNLFARRISSTPIPTVQEAQKGLKRDLEGAS